MSGIVVWSKPRCVQCNGVKRFLDKRGIAYEERQLLDHLEKIEEFREMGLLQAPIVEAPGFAPFSGFQDILLKDIIASLEDPNEPAVG